MDHHRYFCELDRMLSIFSEHKLFLPDGNGYGGVLWQMLTFYQIQKFPRLWRLFSNLTNALLSIPITVGFTWRMKKVLAIKRFPLREYRFYYTYLYVNHGFCGWAVK